MSGTHIGNVIRGAGVVAYAMLAPIVTPAQSVPDAARVDFHWGARIPLRDGVQLSATVYTPRNQKAPAPCIFTLTPYISETYHERGVYFASHGLPFVTVDVRGRGNSDGAFIPMLQEAHDGYDVVEWLAKQPYCNGKVGMWGGSYAGYDQWATAKELPPHLATIVPVAAPHPGADFPILNNTSSPWVLQWLTLTSGRALQQTIVTDRKFWAAIDRRWFESGRPFRTLDMIVGNPSASFQQWIAHPQVDAYWDSFSPTVEQYGKLDIPILTITGSYDANQRGALTHYREHMLDGSPRIKARHYLIIGPWDHGGTRTPRAEFGGLTLGSASLLDLPKLHLDWYAWTMEGGPKPEFLKQRVAYYVMEAEEWRYSESLEQITSHVDSYYLDSTSDPTDVLASGLLNNKQSDRKAPDQYVYDPHDTSGAALEATVDQESLVDQHMLYFNRGKELVYHTRPFTQATEISGFFQLTAWFSIDQPDTDFSASVYEIGADGTSILLASDFMRARFRNSLRKPELVHTKEPLRYTFKTFPFISRQIKKGNRLRLVVAPVNSIFWEKNFNSGGVVADESMADARAVTVKLYHNHKYPSVLYVPIGRSSDSR